MRLIDLDAIMAQFPDADFDGDVIENMKKYPHWKIGIDGLINVLKVVPIIEQSEDCVSRDEVLKDQLSVYTKEYGEIDVVAVEYIESLPSVTSSYNSIKTELKPCEDCISREEAKKLIQGKIDDIPKNKDGTYGSMFGQYVNGLYCAKTAISYMSSVVPQTKRGNWIETSLTPISGDDFNRGFKCSCCDYVTVVDDFNFCPNCGAKMEVEE